MRMRIISMASALLASAVFAAAEPLFPISYNKLFATPSRCDQVVKKQVYTACYDYGLRDSRVVAYSLDRRVGEGNIKNRPFFYPEWSIPKRYRAYPSDYTRSGFDRGHMRPDAATDWDPNLLLETYSMVNIEPQYPMVNRKMWSKAERYARYVAMRMGKVNVVNLVVFSPNPQRIGRHRVAVPSGFYKILYDDSQQWKRCFYYKNLNYSMEEARKDRLRSHLVPCESIDLEKIFANRHSPGAVHHKKRWKLW